MEFNGISFLILILSPVVAIAILIAIIAPLFMRNLPKTRAVEKKYREKQEELSSEFKESAQLLSVNIKIKRSKFNEAIQNGAFRDKEDLQNFIDNHRKEINIIYQEFDEDVSEHIQKTFALAKMTYRDTTKQFNEESGHADTMKVMKMGIKDFFK
jgi:hypothetical protein